jgi:ubiquinone/menaquinone biosynthesis C-methylase UbiE
MSREVPGWDEHAKWWIEGFTGGVDPEYEEQIIPLAVSELEGNDSVIDIGCGEGQIARALSAVGCRVTAVDPTPLHIETARARGGGVTYLLGDASHLPVGDSSQDAAVACLVFEHIDDLEGAVSEIARVLKPGGTFSFFLNHPLLQTPDSGWVEDYVVDPPEQYWRIGAYLVETESVEEVEPGVFVRFLHRPLSKYVNTMSRHGLHLAHMLEPSPPEGFLQRAPGYTLAATVPRLLYMRFTRGDAG